MESRDGGADGPRQSAVSVAPGRGLGRCDRAVEARRFVPVNPRADSIQGRSVRRIPTSSFETHALEGHHQSQWKEDDEGEEKGGQAKYGLAESRKRDSGDKGANDQQ